MKRKTFFLLLAISLIQITQAQSYWQQKVEYLIDVTLNDQEKTLDGFERLVYKNNSPDTLDFIWFHIWPNAYKNDRTAFSDQLLENGNTKFYFSNKEERGYINRLDFKVDGATAKMEDHPQHIDIIKLVLPKRLSPNQQITITTPFHVKLPFNFSRGGYDGESFQATQWYPKPAVYDKKGWHPMPYLDQGEFYSEFGSFDIRITLPQNYIVAATGELQNEEEKAWLKTNPNKNSLDEKNVATSKSFSPSSKNIKPQSIPSSSKNKTLRFVQTNVHDFAWFANKEFWVNHDTCLLASGKTIDVWTYYTALEKEYWKNSVAYTKDGVRFYSTEVGEYPYNVVSVVQGPASFGGGMEYPTITVITPMGSAKSLDLVIAHEIGHNWFYGILGSNERDHPWMDEGINSFYERKYERFKYGDENQGSEILFQTKAIRRTDQPIETSSGKFSQVNYGVVAYHKTAEWMRALEKIYGADKIRNAIRKYFGQWSFKHPYPEDFKTILQSEAGVSDEQFVYLNAKGILPGNELKGFSIVSPFKKNSIKDYLKTPIKNALVISPILNANLYDKLMIGGVITNYKLPPNQFQFLLIPMYATGSKKAVGFGRLAYYVHTDGFIRKTDISLNAGRFTMDDFEDTAGRKIYMQYSKIVPGVKLTFREKNPRSTIGKQLQWRTFLFTEESLGIKSDTVFSGSDTALVLLYSTPKEDHYLNQLRFTYENFRALYPFHISLNVEQAKDFVRPTLTANYFFNYAKGGLGLRFFAGKFLYLGEKTIRKQFQNDRYHLNMTGPKGYEDYTYSEYFAGRNEFEGLANQQIAIRDGGFKVRTDLLASKIGKTDDWLIAMNFNSTIPDKINPLSVLPIKIPIRVFADIGTYAEAWDRSSDMDRLLFDAGLHIPLFQEIINVYIPLFYNRSYSDYFKSTIPKNRLLKNISFTINFDNKTVKNINRELEF